MCQTAVYFHQGCQCFRSMLHLCGNAQDCQPCPRSKTLLPSQYQKILCPYHNYLHLNPGTLSVPGHVGRIISSSGFINSSADAERKESLQDRTNVVIFYFLPIEECAGRMTIGSDGSSGRYAMDGIDVPVDKIPFSEISPIPTPPPHPPMI